MNELQAQYVDILLRRSRKSWDGALLLINEGYWEDAVNRIYYASFYAVNALLATKGIEHSKHSGVRSDFNLQFIHTGLIEQRHAKFYNKLFDSRNQSDYDMLTILENDTVLIWHESAKLLIEDIEEYLKNNSAMEKE